jgi:O-antigen/teichoic acid export membrane protein
LKTNLFRTSFFLLATSSAGSGLGFLFWLAVARFYSAADLGLAATLFGVVLFLAGAGTLGLQYGIIRFLPSETNQASLVNAAFTTAGITSAALGLLFLAGLDLWAPGLVFLRSSPALAVTCLISIVGFTLANVLDAALAASRRADLGTIRAVIFGLIRLPIPILLAGLLGILFAWTLALAVSLILGAFLLLPRVLSGYRLVLSLDAIRGKGIFGYSLWNHGAAITAGVPLSLLPLVILNSAGPNGGAEASAYFFAATAIASALYVVPSAFTTSLFVEGSHPEARYARDVRHAIGFSLALLALGILAAVALGRWVLGLFGGAYSVAGYETFVLLALTSPLILANNVFTTELRVAKRIRPLFAIMVLASASTLLLAYVFLPIWGIAGGAGAFGLGQAIAVPLFAYERTRNGSTRLENATK